MKSNERKKPRGIRKPKGYSKDNHAKNLHLAQWGSLSAEAVRVFKACRAYDAYLRRKIRIASDGSFSVESEGLDKNLMRVFGRRKKDVEKIPVTIGVEIANRILWALARADGYFFKDLARLCERNKTAPDHLREVIALAQISGETRATVRDAKNNIKARGFSIPSDQTFYEVAKEMGHKFALAKKHLK